MEASGTPTPPADSSQTEASPPPPPPTTPESADGKAGGGWRVLSVLLALALAFATAVMIVVAVNPDNTPRCDQIQVGECFDISKTLQTVQIGFAWAAGLIGGLATLLALFVAATGRRGGTLMKFTVATLVLGGITVILGQI